MARQSMEDVPFASIINNYHEKLLLGETMRELELLKKVNTELIRQLNIANIERDQAREQLQILLLNNLNNNNNNNNNNLVMFQTTTKANSNITAESNSISHVSSPADSLLFETASSSFHHQELNNVVDVESARIDGLVNGKVLPEKGKLVEAIKNAGPILKNLMLAAPIPTWENPQPPVSPLQLNLPGGVSSNNGGVSSSNSTCFFISNSSSIVKRKRLH